MIFKQLKWMVAVVTLSIVSLVVSKLHAAPLVIEPGFDFFLSNPETFFTVPSLPAGFFGQKNGVPSDVTLEQQINGVGVPPVLGSFPGATNFAPGQTCHVSADEAHSDCVDAKTVADVSSTVVQRGGTTLPDIGDSDTVPIKIVELHLKNFLEGPTDPLEVTYGSQPSSFFDVFADLNPNAVQDLGSLGLTRLAEVSGIMETELPVAFRFTFRERGGPLGPFIATGKTVLFGPEGPGSVSTWNVVPEPSTLLLLGTGLAGIAVFGRRRLAKKA